METSLKAVAVVVVVVVVVLRASAAVLVRHCATTCLATPSQ
jgi:hypothetical protein